ncbi:NUDIX hydrolase [Prauserella oleivorans]|uniref:NUDIX hydrolase n=1 Tax=Prauserella oleivorans TaxID=1478153 RepID=A0ABW5WGD3_9PSEU
MPGSAGRSGGAKPGRRSRRRRGRRLTTVNETSAGGLVVDPERANAVLIGRLDRHGRLLWSLPKGHIEDGETTEETAVREVKEETGITAHVLRPLGTIDYWFVAERRRIHKTVHHFLLEACGGELSDEDVEVTEVAWVPLTELESRLAYADERKLVRKARELFDDSRGVSKQ